VEADHLKLFQYRTRADELILKLIERDRGRGGSIRSSPIRTTREELVEKEMWKLLLHCSTIAHPPPGSVSVLLDSDGDGS